MIIWYIDDNDDDLATCKDELIELTDNKIEVKAEKPLDDIKKMTAKILDEIKTVAVVIDQRLGDSKDGVIYNGLDLAREIRCLNNKIPIYILTIYPHDLSPNEWEIEYVFSKDDFKHNQKTISKRLNRHINIFNDITDEREQRFSELLKKSISETLTEDELKEIGLLDSFRSASLLQEEMAETSHLKIKLDEQEKLLNQIKAKLEEDDVN